MCWHGSRATVSRTACKRLLAAKRSQWLHPLHRLLVAVHSPISSSAPLQTLSPRRTSTSQTTPPTLATIPAHCFVSRTSSALYQVAEPQSQVSTQHGAPVAW